MAGSKSNVDVFLKIHGQRAWSKEVSKAAAELEAIGFKGAKGLDAFAKKADTLKSFGKSWTRNVSLPVAGLAAISGKMAIDFHQAMSLVQTQAGASAKETRFLEGAVLRMGENSKFGPTDLADALFRVRSAGFKAKEALDVLREGKNLSTVGNSDLELTTKALTGAAKSLKLKKAGQLHGLAAEMNAIVGTGDMRMEELQDALSTGVLPAFVSAGLGLRDYGSALTVMTDRNVPAQVASTRLRTAVTMLVPHTKKAESALEGVGIQSETLATIMRKKGLPSAIKFLADHLDKLSLNKQNRVMIEAFGGAKSSATLETLVENSDELFNKWDLIGKGVGKFNKEIGVAGKQPGAELEKAWSRIQVSLIKIGDELLPEVVPGVKKLAGFGQKAAAAFLSLPGAVKGVGVATLVAIGPISSMLGYLAQGTGRFLTVANGLAKAGIRFNTTLSPNVMTEKSGFKGALSAAFGGTGAAGALSAAKGFATAIGPAVALYGIGNVATSAMSGDWEEAGSEAALSVAGGLLGSFGGPAGTMLGIGLGSLGGELLSGLFQHGSQLPTLQEKIASSSRGIKAAFEGEAEASKRLLGLQKRVSSARGREKSAAQELRTAEHHLEVVRATAPAGSRAVAKAESSVAKSIEHVTNAKRRAKQAERLKGEARTIAKEQFRYAALEEHHRKHLLKNRIYDLRQNRRAAKARGASLQELKPTNDALVKNMDRLRTVNRQTNKTYEEAANEIGPKFAGFLHHASREAITLGSKLKATSKLLKEFNEESEAYVQAHSEGFKTIGEAEEWRNSFFGKLGVRPRPIEPHRAKPHQRTHRHRDARYGGSSNGTAQARRLSFYKPGALNIPAGSATESGDGRDINITVQSVLDGKVVAENTTKWATRGGLLA